MKKTLTYFVKEAKFGAKLERLVAECITLARNVKKVAVNFFSLIKRMSKVVTSLQKLCFEKCLVTVQIIWMIMYILVN